MTRELDVFLKERASGYYRPSVFFVVKVRGLHAFSAKRVSLCVYLCAHVCVRVCVYLCVHVCDRIGPWVRIGAVKRMRVSCVCIPAVDTCW
jgi:hypothetical protein